MTQPVHSSATPKVPIPPDPSSTDEEIREEVANILDRYLERIERGESIDRAELEREYPELADQLAEYLEGLQWLQQGATDLRFLAPPGVAVTDARDANQFGGRWTTTEGDASDELSTAAPASVVGDYELLRVLARGGMGIVYEARQRSLNRRVALKILPFAATLDRRKIIRFEHEARSAASLHHEHIVPIYEVGAERGIHYYAMQFIDGVTLRELIDALSRTPAIPISAAPANSATPANSPAPTNSATPANSAPPKSAAAAAAPESATLPAEGTPELRVSLAAQRVFRGENGSSQPLASEGSVVSPLTALSADSPEELDDDTAQLLTRPLVQAWQQLWRERRSEYCGRVAQLGQHVAQALQAAHECGIVHRDIKPSNLLLNDQGKIWVTDFGLAVGQAPAHLTRTGELVGTLHYMSPEQTRGQNMAVDPRTDIYSLGATLYALLSLQEAFAGENQAMVLHQIENGQTRRWGALAPWVPRDLESVVHKAMSVDRDERYATAGELAEDLNRFLAGVPTIARPLSPWKRARRWLARRRQLVTIAALVLAVICVGLTAATVWIAQQNQLQRVTLERAEANLGEARSAIKSFGLRAAELLAATPATEHVRQAVLSDVLAYHRRLLRQAHDSPALQADAALAYGQIGLIEMELGRAVAAIEAFGQAEKILTELAGRDPENLEYGVQLGRCLNNLARGLQQQASTSAAAETLVRALQVQQDLTQRWPANSQLQVDVAGTWNNLGLLHASTGDTEQAAANYREAERLLPPYDGRDATAESREMLASVLNNMSVLWQSTDPVASRTAAERSVAIREFLCRHAPGDREQEARLAGAYNNAATIAVQLDDLSGAVSAYQQAILRHERLVAEEPFIVDHRRDLAVTCNNCGLAYHRQGKLAEATQWFTKSLALQQQLVEQFPTDGIDRSRLGGVYNNLASVWKLQGRWSEALDSYRLSVFHQRLAVERAPTVSEYREFLSRSLLNYAKALRTQGDWLAAAERLAERRDLLPEDSQRLMETLQELTELWDDTEQPAHNKLATTLEKRQLIAQYIRETAMMARQVWQLHPQQSGERELKGLLAGHPQLVACLQQLAKE